MFALDYSPEELAHAYVQWRYGETSMDSGRSVPADIHLIAPMVRYIGLLDEDPNDCATEFEGSRHFYRCTHWDAETGLCQIYEFRPLMCRTYPDDNRCDHGCDFSHELIQIGGKS